MATKATKKAIQTARDKFAERYAKNHGDTLDRSGIIRPYDVISTGCLSVDFAMGVGGYVEGRLYEIWGVDAIGKTTFALQGVREAQAKHPDKLVLWIDMEHTFDKKWAAIHGVDISANGLWIDAPDSAEEVADKMKDALRSGLFSMIVLDSIGAMIPEAEKEKDADQATMAIQAKIVTRMVKIAAVEADTTSTVVIMLNQVRANLSYGADTTTGGGFALKHVTTGKLKLSPGGERPFQAKVPGQEKPVDVGREVAVMCERNKVAPPRRRASFVLFHTPTPQYGPVGIDQADDATAIGIRTGVISQSGAWYTLPNEEKFNGREKVVNGIRGRQDVIGEIRDAALATLDFTTVVSDDSNNPLADPETGEILADIEASDIEGVRSKFGSLTESMAGAD